MKFKLFKTVTFKLVLLVFVALLALIGTSLLFNSQIDKLKSQIDNLYFGNFVPIVKLNNIKNNYKSIISCRTMKYICDFKKEEKIILDEWDYYYNSYKNEKERNVINNVDLALKETFKVNKLHIFKNIVKKIEFLIDYETKTAFKQRKLFVEEYKKMKDYLFFNILLLLILTFAMLAYIIYQVVKKDNQLRVLNTKYKIDSITDSMTKLYNRKYFDTIFDNMPFIANANNWECAFIMFDIDFFKQYNDTYGHDLGDETLKKVANVLKEYFNNKYEFVFRLGGEEFGVVLFDIDIDILESCLKEINKKIVDLKIEHKTSEVLDFVTISIGAIMYRPNTYISANKLYKRADDCLYKSKHNGRNQYHIFKGE
ncbi:MAG: GGDEF domain-containing protein [Arcobacter sp.]|nr:GGDEF domain-containing protein [Arcobacter sp.]|tara:strand:- start:450 stop:1556 length:1107 start_codon:yes stop_codon:yes gene_type:complete